MIKKEKNKKSKQQGLTLIEVIVAIGVLMLILSLGLFISMDFYRNYSFRSEKSVLISTLQNARGQSLANINQVRHGVHIQGNPLSYIIFECPSGTPACTSYTASSNDLIVTPSYKSTVTSPSIPFDIIFDQLSGECVSCSSPVQIQLNDGVKTYTITINNMGRIDW